MNVLSNKSMYKSQFDKQKFIGFLLICFPDCKDFKDIKGL